MVRLLLLLAMSSPLAQAVHLQGKLTQGSLITGTVVPGSEVRLDGKPIQVSASGDIVFGFDRKAKLHHQLTVKAPNKPVEKQPITLTPRKYKIQRINGLPKKMVTPDPAFIKRIRREAAAVATARLTDSARTDFTQGFIWPAKGRISGVYGSQRILNGHPKTPHYGLDIAAPQGAKVVAPADGVVTFWQPDLYFSGGTMIIDHGQGVSSTFLHLSASLVKVGDKVKQGQQVARVGHTGRATGPHLDWRINWFLHRLDPQLVVPAR